MFGDDIIIFTFITESNVKLTTYLVYPYKLSQWVRKLREPCVLNNERDGKKTYEKYFREHSPLFN